jgi:hypothetical protein
MSGAVLRITDEIQSTPDEIVAVAAAHTLQRSI